METITTDSWMLTRTEGGKQLFAMSAGPGRRYGCGFSPVEAETYFHQDGGYLSRAKWANATIPEMTAAGATLEQATAWAHESVREGLWYPEQVPGFGPWFEWGGNTGWPPVSDETEVAILLREDREAKRYGSEPNAGDASGFVWRHFPSYPCADLVAYCVRLSTPAEPQQAAAPQPAPAIGDKMVMNGEVHTIVHVCHENHSAAPEPLVVWDWDPLADVFAAIPQHLREQMTARDMEMVERDGLPPTKPAPAAITPAPAFMLPDRSGLMVVADVWSPR